MKSGKSSLLGVAFGLALGGAVVVALPVSEARAEKAGPGTAALEARVRQLETRMAKVEARMAEHEKPQAGHAAHGGQTGMPGNAPDQPMGQMPQQHTMPPQADPQQGMPMGGGTGGGMTDM